MKYIFSFIFQIYNRVNTIDDLLMPFIEAINNGVNAQLIIGDDGSTDGTREKIQELIRKYLNNKTCVDLLFTEDVFEIEHNWKCVQLSEAEILVFIQDDDYYENVDFAIKAKKLFDLYPRLTMLSPKHGIIFDGNGAWITYGDYNSTDGKLLKPTYNEDGLMLTEMVDKAPLLIKRSWYDQLGGIDREYKVGAYTEHDLCMKASKEGLHVGVYHTLGYHFRRWEAGSGRPGSKITSHHGTNRARFYSIHGDYIKELQKGKPCF